jgi:DNA-binding MarR family transcriptional regulator
MRVDDPLWDVRLDNYRYNDYYFFMVDSVEMKTRARRGTASRQEAFINILRTADALESRLAATLKDSGLSPTQYNVLRILRGAQPEGLACREIGERMITRDPDITRLIDRLERVGFVSRSRELKDRRVVIVKITSTGLRVLKALDSVISAFHDEVLGHMSEKELSELTSLLEASRSRAA